MTAVLAQATDTCRSNPFDLEDDAAYRSWRDERLARRPRRLQDLVVDLRDPRALTAEERAALLDRCARANMVVYRSPLIGADPALPRLLGRQLGLERLDANWLAEEDGISRIAVGGGRDGAEGGGGFIPYTDRGIKWHTDGYYHPEARRIRGMILHCVRPAAEGGVNRVLDHELVYIALREASPRWVRALMAPDAMTIPAREGAEGVARAAQTGPVFSVDPVDGHLHMRYTARTRSIEWKDDIATAKAVAFLEHLLAEAEDGGDAFSLKLGPGMGIVANNVLHDRSAFVDDPAAPRLLYRARYLDRVAEPDTPEAPWRSG
jgi:hypothetical protein